MKIKLKRYFMNENITLGIMKYENKFICYTVERPYKNNETNVSCIKEGKYKVNYVNETEHFPYSHYILEDKNGRENIAIHRGNFVDDSLGCILPNTSVDDKRGYDSKKALEKLMKFVEIYRTGQIFLEVKNE